MPPDRHLLIDAYNVIHAWPELRRALAEHGPAAAQARLADLVRPIHDAEGWRVTLVFDGKGEEISIERPGKETTFSFAFSPRGLTADGVIQQLAAQAGQSGRKSEIVVASRDNLLGESAAANGARVVSPEGLREWCEAAAARERGNITARLRESNKDWRAGPTPWDGLEKIRKTKPE